MLTRLEVDGFKNLSALAVDFGPLTCIAGANATGKSNLFDAIEFLAALADNPLMEAAQRVRGIGENRAADPRDLFWNGYAASSPTMYFAAEMIVPYEIEDDFGQRTHATITFLRYELEIGYSGPSGSVKRGRLALLSEKLRHIKLGDAPTRLRFPHSSANWRAHLLRGRRSGTDFISTHKDEHTGETVVRIHQDGGSRGQPKVASVASAPATIISTTTQANDPTILAARREMQRWQRLALEPSAMRTPNSYSDPQIMNVNGRYIAGALYRVALSSEEPARDVYARVAARLASLTGLRVQEIGIQEDDARETLTIVLTEASGIQLPARSLSEGTLRFLALCVLLEDPLATGLLCMEEPENGIHPANIPAMLDLIQDLAVDPSVKPGSDNPLRQMIINTHSPNIVQLVDPNDLLFADVKISADGSKHSGLRLRPMHGTWRAAKDAVLGVGKTDLIDYLIAPAGAQLELQSPAA